MVEILVPIALFAMIFGIVYVVSSSRHKQIMAMIEKGADPALFRRKGRFNKNSILKYGLLFIGVGVGILLGNLLESMAGLQTEAAYFSMILLFGGAGLITAFLIEGKKKEEKSEG